MITAILDPNITLEPIEMGFRKDIDPDSVADYTQNIGKQPFIFFKQQALESKDIIYLKMKSDSFFPTIELIFKDPLGQYFDTLYPLDSEYISFFLKSRSPNAKSIRIDFTINTFNITKSNPGDNEDRIYTMTGRMKFNDYMIRCYYGNSYDVLKSISKEADLGFASNLNKTNDTMTWINQGYHLSEFVPDITLCSYKDDDTFLWSYIDVHYYMNYIDIESELNSDISEQTCTTSDSFLSNDVVISPLILDNNPDNNGTNLYIDKYRIDNSSYITNWDLGYNSFIYYYDKIAKNMNIYELDTISTVGKDKNLIIQKGRPYDNLYKLINRRNYYIGKMDTDNIHPNYLYAYQQNVNNIKFLEKIKMVIVLRNLNFELRRYQLVEIILYNLDKMEGDTRNQSGDAVSQQDGDRVSKINQRLSGQWLITAINYTFENKSGIQQELTVVKRELTAEYKNITQKK